MNKYQRDCNLILNALSNGQRGQQQGQLVGKTNLRSYEVQYVLKCLVEDKKVNMELVGKLQVPIYSLNKGE